MDLIYKGLDAFNIPIYTKEGFEGDDIIGTISKKAKELGHKTYILTGDRDSLQLVDKEGFIKVLIPSKGELVEYDWDKVYEKMGVYPNQVIDYKALCGDTSDNIPGVKGIGPKTACDLLLNYETLDGVYANIDKITKKSVVEKLNNEKETAYLSQFLATIKQDVEIDFNFDKTCLEIEKKLEVVEYFRKLQFFSFVKNIDKLLKPFICKDEEQTATNEEENIVKFSDETFSQTSLFGNIEVENKKIGLTDRKEVDFKSFNPNEKIAFLIKDNICHLVNSENYTSCPLQEAVSILENEKIEKITFDIKNALHILPSIKGVAEDVMLTSYVLDSSRKHDLISQAESYLESLKEDDKSLCVSIYDLSKCYERKLTDKEKKLCSLELKLAGVLFKMEKTGVTLDLDYMKVLSSEIDSKIQEYEAKIYKEAGVKFNINSPKQVADVLFNVLEIKPKKKNKTGYSTNAKILEELAEENQIARDILEHRTYMKLKTTYVDNLPKLTDNENKIHTHYNQTVTATGRLSSSDPNMQNIPIKTDFSNRIRAAFVASDRENYSILSADYSQIELRLLAHISGDEALINAFKGDIDVHTLTASKIFGVSENEVTKEMRRKAKAVNFGIIYGQTRYGLSSALGITPFEAQDFIDKYFRQYPKINQYITNTLMEAHEKGYVETLFGRRRYLKEELNSRNTRIREFAERAAINAPLQGTSADLIKMAMVELDGNLKNYRANILIQVHDELVLEVHNEDVDPVSKIVLESMELGQPLDVPLEVSLKVGKSWMESK